MNTTRIVIVKMAIILKLRKKAHTFHVGNKNKHQTEYITKTFYNFIAKCLDY